MWLVGRLPVSLLVGSLPGGGLGAWRAACFADGLAFWLCRLAGRSAAWAVPGLALGSLAGLLLLLLAGLHAGSLAGSLAGLFAGGLAGSWALAGLFAGRVARLWAFWPFWRRALYFSRLWLF